MHRKTTKLGYGLVISVAIGLMCGCDGEPKASGSASTASPGSATTTSAASATSARAAAVSGAPTSSAVSDDATATCEKAAERYIGCMEQLLGEEAGALARSKQAEGVPVCARDALTVSMYRKCLPEADCEKFQKCMMDFAKDTDPKRAPSP